MKLGVSFRIFSGLELLKPSIQNVREFADYVVGVYSTVSRCGDPAADYMMDLLHSLVREGLIDKLILCNETGGPHCGRLKDKVGQTACLKRNCTHYMCRDCDEFYDKAQFAEQLKTFENYDICGAKIIPYISSGTNLFRKKIQKKNTESGPLFACVPVVHRINLAYHVRNRQGIPQTDTTGSSIYFDPRRLVRGIESAKIFEPKELVMHHMYGVRINLTEWLRKQQGHANCCTMSDEIYIDTWQKRKQSAGRLLKAEDQFGIMKYWLGEARQWFEMDLS